VKRRRLTGSRSWFNGDNALRFPGNPQVTEDPNSREDLYLTASGRWILHRWSIRPGQEPQWVEIMPGEAIRWLELCGYTDEAEKFRRKLRRASRW